MTVSGQIRASSVHVAALDALAIGIAICDPCGRIIFANLATEELLRGKADITLGARGQELSAIEPGGARTLARLIEDAAQGGRGGVARLSGAKLDTLIISVTPLPPHLEADYGSGHLLVTLTAPGATPSLTEAMLVALFELSPTQASIALAIFNGNSPEAIAHERGIKISTLRTHLTEVFQRTATQNQRDLVRLLATLPPLR